MADRTKTDPDPSQDEAYDTPLQVRRVVISGNTRTKEEVLRHCLTPVLVARTVGGIANATHHAGMAMYNLQLIRGVDFILDDATEYGTPIPGKCDLRVELWEPRLPFELSVNTTVASGNLKPELAATVAVPNVFGRGERFALKVAGAAPLTVNTEQEETNLFQASLTKPMLGRQSGEAAGLDVFRMTQHLLSSAMQVRQTGFSLNYTAFAPLLIGNQTQILTQQRYSYDLAWRESTPGPDAPMGVRLWGGHSVKSSLKHVLSFDTRDNPFMPTRGIGFTTTNEMSGIGGDVCYYKNETAVQYNYPLPYPGAALSLGLRTGYIHDFNEGVPVPDRLFFGAGNILRGFDPIVFGPRQSNKNLGGTLSYLASAQLSWPLPLASADAIKGHLFVNSGSLVNYDHSSNLPVNLEKLQKESRVAVGGGIAMLTQIGRIELNLCHPLRFQPEDRTRNWEIQLGFSMV